MRIPAWWIAYRLGALSSSPAFVALANWGARPADDDHDDDGLDDQYHHNDDRDHVVRMSLL